jgi:hypothetical protein
VASLGWKGLTEQHIETLNLQKTKDKPAFAVEHVFKKESMNTKLQKI